MRFLLLASPLVLACALFGRAPEVFVYPETRRVEQVDDYHGTAVADPYRWLENLQSDETGEWVRRQNELSNGFLERIPQRAAILARLTKLWNFEKYGLPTRGGQRYFYTRNDGLQDQSVYYVAEGLHAPGRVLLNPNELSEDGTVSLAGFDPSPDGRYLAYGLSQSGSDWATWFVRDVTTGMDLSERLEKIRFSGASWLHDGSGFYYSRSSSADDGESATASAESHRVFFHRVGTPESADELVYERPEERRWLFGPEVSEDDRYLLLWTRPEGTRNNGLFYRDRRDPRAKLVELLADYDASYSFVGNNGPVFWIWTDRGAPRGRVLAIDLRKPQPQHWKEVIPEGEHPLRGVRFCGGRFVAVYLVDAHSAVKLYDRDGRPERELELPGEGTAWGFDGTGEDPEIFFGYTSHTQPGTIYRHELDSGTSSVFREPTVDFDPAAFEVKQVFYASRDGTRVPMFVMHRKGIELDGRRPTLLTGYGGFDISVTPSFSLFDIVFMEMGGVVARPNLRGGGEYGEQWHQAGMKANKQNVFDDFIAAAEWLIASGYTRPERLAMTGRSNGGLLVGAVMTQRPELFAAALPGVGVLDMLRFHRFTIGWAWISEYGSPDDPAEFPTLYAYSPLHRLRPGVRYPATLVFTSDNDDRVVPSHSYKFTSALQAVQAPDRPALIRVEVSAGHGAGTPTTRRIEEAADLQAFLVRVLDMDASGL